MSRFAQLARSAEATFVGEANPYGSDPRYAFYPEPPNSAGGRLCRLILGLPAREYLRRFDRVNLCSGAWDAKEARRVAGAASWNDIERGPVVLLGSKVCAAFGLRFEPFTLGPDCRELVILPHPSGLCRLWAVPGAIERARAVLIEAGVLP